MHYLIQYHLMHFICCTSNFQSCRDQVCVFLVYLDSSFFKLKFTPFKSEKSLQGMQLQEKESQMIKAYRISPQKKPIPISNRCLLILHLQLFKSQMKGKHSIGREFHSLAVRGKKLLTYTSLYHLRMVTKKSWNLSE